MDWLSLLIFSSNGAAAARALLQASLAAASSLLAEVPCLPLHGVLCFALAEHQQVLTLPVPLAACPLSDSFCCNIWFLKEDTTSLVSSLVCWGPHGGDPGNLLSLYTWWYRSLISSLLVCGPTTWTAEMSACGSRCGRPCQQPWQIICSASLLPEWAAWRNISWRIRGQCNPSASQHGYLSKNISVSICHSISLMDRPSLLACSLVARVFFPLPPYHNSRKPC